MQLSNSNELVKFYTIDEIKDEYGGVKKEQNKAFTLFGRLSLVQIDHKNCRTYAVKIQSNTQLAQYSNRQLVISTNNKYYLVKDIIINKKLTTIKCHDYQYSTDDI